MSPESLILFTVLVFKQYRIENYSHWLQQTLNKTRNWKHISDCLLNAEFCDRVVGKISTTAELAKKETSVQSGCCRPPVQCGYPMINVTYYDLSQPVVVPLDCTLYQNAPNIKCFSCSSCRGGVAQSAKKEMMIVAGANIALIIFLLTLYIVGCCARQHASEARYIKMQKKGLEDIKQVQHSHCPSGSCGSCLDGCCLSCSKEAVQEVEDILSPRHCYGKRKVTLPSKDNLELVYLQQEKTCWCSSCSSCCQKRRKRKRELACCEPEQINLDDLDPTLVFKKKKALEDHDQVAYRREDDLTLLDYLEAGWPVQEEEAQQGSKCFPFFCCKKKKLDTKQKGKANASCCTSPCGAKKKGVELNNFKKIDNSLALASTKQKGKSNLSCCKSPCGDRTKGVEVKVVEKTDNLVAIAGGSSGTLVWDKPPPITQQDLSKNSKDQPEATLMKKNTQIHDNVLFDQESTKITPQLESSSDGGPIPPLVGEGAKKTVDEGATKTGQLPQGWSWLMENSNSTNTPRNVDKEPDVQTRFVHILTEIVDTRFKLKDNHDDMDISEKKEKNSPRKLKYKEREDNVETSLVQFAKPEIVDKRFQLKSKDDAFQKKEEKFQMIEEDVERLGVLHNKLGILHQQLLQKEQILVLEEKLKEQGNLQRRKEELALEKEQLEILREKTRGRGHLEINTEEIALEKEHLALLREVMNEKEQLERKKEEFIMEKKHLEMIQEEQLERKKEEIIMEQKHLEMLQEEQLERKKAELIMEKRHIEMLRDKLCQQEKEDLDLEKQQLEVLQKQFSLEEKGKLKMREQEIAIEKEKVEMLREKLNGKEKVQLELKKEELSLQLEMTKEELLREKQQFKAMKETLNSEEKVQIEKSKVQLAFERKQLEELREKLNFKEKDELKKKKEMLDNVLMQLEMLSSNLSSKDTILLEKKKEVLTREKGPFELLQEKEKAWKNKGEYHWRDFVKDTADSNGSKGYEKSKYDRKNAKILPLTMLTDKTLWGNNENKKAGKVDWGCQSSFDKVTNSVGGFTHSSSILNNYGLALKTTLPPQIENQEKTEELFEIENKRQGGILELTMREKKSQYGTLEKRLKGKQHMEHDLGNQACNQVELIDCFKKVKEGVHNKLDKKVYPKGADDDKKRPCGSHEYDDHNSFYRSVDQEGQFKNSEFLKENVADHKKKLHKTLHSDDLTSQHGNKFDCGLTQARFENSCTSAKQLLSYNFDPPKKRSGMEPLKKKAKKSDNICAALPNITPSCGGIRLDFPGRLKTLSSYNIKDIKSSECFNQHERVLKNPNKDSSNIDEKKRSNVKIEPKSEKPRTKAKFRFRGLLDEKAQNKLLGKLKELELQDLKTKLADKKKLLEKLEKSETSTSRNPKSPERIGI